ncbi:hypothetical protein ACIBF6_28805 [Streptosporangium amethystogenes]|uniref:hypothetical protein n=1 Tax=Streptosporangium amethystogenes TaxID=2002 RepID=UPI0037A00EA0
MVGTLASREPIAELGNLLLIAGLDKLSTQFLPGHRLAAHCSLLEVSGKTHLCRFDRHVVPTAPVAGLVSGDQEHSWTPGDQEEDSDVVGTGPEEAGTVLLCAKPAELERVVYLW